MSVDPHGEPRRLPFVGEDGSMPAISRDGARLAYVRTTQESNIWRLPVPGQGRAASRAEPIIRSTGRDQNPDYSPDGRGIAFESDRSGNREIWVCDNNGSNVRRLTTYNGPLVGSPRWSPDGVQIAFDAFIDGDYQIHLVAADGVGPRRVTAGFSPDWSPNGKWILYASNRGAGQQIYKIPASGGEAVQLTQEGGDRPQVSPDGKWVYYLKPTRPGEDSLWRSSLEGGAEEQVLDSVSQLSFAVVKDGVYFFPPPSAEGRTAILFRSFTSGETAKIYDSDQPTFYFFTASPDSFGGRGCPTDARGR